MVGSRAGIARALRDGAARVASGPAVLAGSVAVLVLLWLLPYPGTGSVGILRGAFPLWLSLDRVPLTEPSLAIMPDVQTAVAWLLLWSFAAGGILDRYARGRATRGVGFFGACGAHFPSMLRLGLLTLAADAAIWAGLARQASALPALTLAVALGLAVHVVSGFARVRIVVEDRRSALGAILAGARFVRRQPAGAALTLIFAATAATVAWLAIAVHPAPYDTLGWQSLAECTALIAINTAVLLAAHASAIALFQACLAHAGYTAAPARTWPDSPAAEAIANAAPVATR
jgi:hypothetical protein